jgi:uncharacterized protein
MAWENSRWQPATTDVNDILVHESRRAFMARVYGWMFAGLTVTGVVALIVASNKPLVEGIARSWWVFGLVQFGLVMALSAMAHRLSAAVAGALFLAYSVLTGLTFSLLFYVYTQQSIGTSFLMAAGTFGALSAFATFTKKDLSGWATFLFMGLIGVVIASVVQLFVHSPMLSFVTSCAAVLVFAGLTAYDTQKLREMHDAQGPGATATLSIVGALSLYLDFINLFIALLRLVGDRRR